MRYPRSVALPRAASASFLAWLAAAAITWTSLGLAGCRDPLCVTTVRETCGCTGPSGKIEIECFTSVDVTTCDPVDAAFHPCAIKPCCVNEPAGDLAGVDAPPGDGGEHDAASDQSASVDGS